MYWTDIGLPIGSMYGIYANIWGILMVNVTIYGIHGSYGLWKLMDMNKTPREGMGPSQISDAPFQGYVIVFL